MCENRTSSRRVFLQRSIAGTLVCTLAPPFSTLLGAEGPAAPYDLLVKGGRVIDPAQGVSALRDVAIKGHSIARVAADISEADARQTLDARGKVVTPGLIDIHVHVYDGVAPLGIPVDPNCVAKGVTTVVDAGSSGAHTFPGLRKYVINLAETRVLVLLNISVVGQSTMSTDNQFGELLNLGHVNPNLAVRTIERNRDVILGIKVRLSKNITGEHDLQALGLAREAAEAVKLPMMVHVNDPHSPIADILAMMRKDDVLTHTYHGYSGGILDERGRVLAAVRDAMKRGVRLDVGHGMGSFSFDVAEKALAQDVLPGTISSDLHQFNLYGPVFDLATTLSKFMHLGLTLEQVIERATSNAAGTFGFPQGLGTLREGAEADVAVFSLVEGDFEFVDSLKQKRIGHRRLLPVATVKAGRIYGGASAPVPVR
ncbi:MAG: amidohydrolase/deacetylase family metallohydrolase [Planctomycetaceae bacterium]